MAKSRPVKAPIGTTMSCKGWHQEAAYRMIQNNLNPKLEIEGVLITMYDSRLNLSNQIVEEVNQYFGDKVYKTYIHRNVKLGEAPSFGKPILLYNASSKGSHNYMSLVSEILNQNG